jgi:hypothetical protein
VPCPERAIEAHQYYPVGLQLAHINDIDGVIGELDAAIGERMRPFAAEVERLDAIIGRLWPSMPTDWSSSTCRPTRPS